MKRKNTLKKFNLKMPFGYSIGIHLSTMILNIFGLLMIISASMTTTINSASLRFDAFKEIGFIMISYYLMVLFAKNFKLSFFKKHYLSLLALMLISLFIPLLWETNGAHAWIRLGRITLQPSEFAKVFVILLMALSLGDKKPRKNKRAWDYLKHPTLVVALFGFIITILQKDLGSAVVLAGVAFVCYLIPSNIKLRKFQLFLVGLFFVGMGFVVFINNPVGLAFIQKLGMPSYMVNRFETSSNPLHDKYGVSLQVFKGLVAFIQGGLVGKGFAQSVNKYGYIPEAHTDFILAIVVEELGMFGFLIIFIGYALILFNLVRYAFRVRLEADKIILIGTASYIIIHFIFNVGGVTALIPLTGVPLLLISSGGSSRMAIMIAIGIAQSVISKQRSHEKRREIT